MRILNEKYAYAMVNYVTATRDFSLFICYDYRQNQDYNKICHFLIDDLIKEEKNCFITRVIE
jgi:hypothetical protein